MSELQRRLVHASGTGAPAIYLVGIVTWEQLGWILLFGSVVALVLEVLRLFVGLDWTIYDRLTREYEQENLAGYALYMFAMTAVALLFEPYAGIPAMLMLTIGDPVSGLVSSGELRSVKRFSVLFVMFGVCFILAFTTLLYLLGSPVLVPAVLGALVATVADGMKPVIAGYVIDDNVTIPLGAAVAIFLAVEYLPAVPF